MAPKRASFISYGANQDCLEVKKFIEGAGIVLDIRDLSKKPFTENELSSLIGYLSMDHFVDNDIHITNVPRPGHFCICQWIVLIARTCQCQHHGMR